MLARAHLLTLAASALLIASACKRASAGPPSPVVELVAGGPHTCARLSDASLHCWGEAGLGLIAGPSPPSHRGYSPLGGEQPYYDLPTLHPAPRDAASIVLGEAHACARLTDGSVRCWGSNGACELGLGAADASPHPTPTLVPGLAGVARLFASGHQTCALLQDGRSRCWGKQGSSSDAGAACSPHPTPAPPGATEIAMGSDHRCVLLADSTVRCWGENRTGQLGRRTPTPEDANRPEAVPGLRDIRELALAGESSCARRGDGAVLCWGANGNGQLGVGDRDERASPSPVLGLAGATRVALGVAHGCAIVNDGNVRCWGAKHVVGDGTGTSALTAVTVPGVRAATRLALGGIATMSHTCALLGDGEVRCWGNNHFGQLGDGSTSFRAGAVAVRW